MRFKITVLLAFGCLPLGWAFWLGQMHERGARVANPLSTSVVNVAAAETLEHPVFPYSVIPGGAYSRAELVRKINWDAVAREHYSGFEINQARLVRLTQDRLQFVSYRKGDRIYWTKKRLVIPQGELLITDGRHLARTRCGNLLSDVPQASVLSSEPTEDIDMPQLKRETLNAPGDTPGVALLEPPETPIPRDERDLDVQIFRLLPSREARPPGEALSELPPPRVSGRLQTIPLPPVAVPEPGFLVPVAAGLGLLFGAHRVTRRTRPTTRC